MDKIWYRNPSKSEVIGRCGGDKKNRMTEDCIYYVKYRDLKCFTQGAVFMYSEIEFQIEVPDKMNELRKNSVQGLGV